MAEQIDLTQLNMRELQHPSDLEALEDLVSMRTMNMLRSKALEIGLDEILRLQSLENKIRVAKTQFRDLYLAYLEVSQRLGVDAKAELFVEQHCAPSVYSSGGQRPSITVSSAALDRLSQCELRFLLGHEVGHIYFGHVPYQQIFRHLDTLLPMLGEMVFGPKHLLETGLRIAFHDWACKANFTADRVGLLAVQDVSVANKTLLKLAGVPDPWIEEVDLSAIGAQVDEAVELATKGARRFRYLFDRSGKFGSRLAFRLMELNSWAAEGKVEQVLLRQGHSEEHRQKPVRICPDCGGATPVCYLSCIFCGRYFDKKG